MQKRFLLKTAGLSDPKKPEVLDGATEVERTRNLPLHGKVPDGPLSGVIVPRDAVFFQEDK